MKGEDARLAVDEQMAARLLSISVATLRRWRREGKGPRAIKISRLVRYRPSDLERFLSTFKDEREKPTEKAASLND